MSYASSRFRVIVSFPTLEKRRRQVSRTAHGYCICRAIIINGNPIALDIYGSKKSGLPIVKLLYYYIEKKSVVFSSVNENNILSSKSFNLFDYSLVLSLKKFSSFLDCEGLSFKDCATFGHSNLNIGGDKESLPRRLKNLLLRL